MATSQQKKTMAKQKIYNSKEYREKIAGKDKPSNSLFGNTWTVIDDIKFQSKAEAEYYGRLKLRKRAGNIKNFRRAVLYSLVVNGVLICTYRADFVIEHNNGDQSVIDVKSEATEGVYSFRLKKKLMKALFNIDVLVVKK
jgi:hypothetical protein